MNVRFRSAFVLIVASTCAAPLATAKNPPAGLKPGDKMYAIANLHPDMQRHLLYTLMDNIPDLIYFKDTESRFTRVNRSQARHLGTDDPEAVVHVSRIATEFRARFKKDVVVDIFCYRRHGHNEADEPAFTQPLMYRAIDSHPTTREIYAQRLVKERTVRQETRRAPPARSTTKD